MPPSAPAGNLVDNGGFEQPVVAGAWQEFPAGTGDIPDWTVGNGPIDIVRAPHWEAPEGSQVVDMDGSSGGAGRLSQSVPTTLGTSYELGLVYSGNPDCGDFGDVSMSVYWDGALVGTVTHDTAASGHTLADFDYQAFEENVTGADESTLLELRSNSGPGQTCGIVVDDVYVVHAAPPVWQADGDGTVLVAGEGEGGPAQLTYSVPDSPAGSASGEWHVWRTATTAGTVEIPWTYTGFHAYFQAQVSLTADVISAESTDTSTPQFTAGPADCDHPDCAGDEPSGGFSYTGTASFTVEPGDVYGFTLTGANADSNDTLRGELTLGTQVPVDCAGAKALYGMAPDGRYAIHPIGGQRFVVFCNGMGTASPDDYLEVPSGAGRNTGSYAAGGAASGTTVTTTFTKVRINPANLTVDINDLAFAESSGSLTHPDAGLGNPTVSSMPYATAMSCDGAASGTANVDLRWTQFAVDDTWVTGTGDVGSAIFTQADQIVDITGGGFCGWNAPAPAYNPFNPSAPDYALQLRYLNEAPAAVHTPVVFASISRSSTTADVYARVEGASNTPLTFEVRTDDSCANGLLPDPSLVATANATSDAAGYVLLDDVPGIASGDFVTIAATAPGSTSPSACVRTTADNDYWPKALGLGASSTLTTHDVIEIPGKARWYRFPVVPDQRITVTLSGLPADYDLAVFRDIGKEFESQLTPQDSADLQQLSAEFAPSVFSPSVFSPSAFSPSVFSPDAYSPSVFSPSVFSPSVFSPSVFSPSVFSPSVFSPSVFSPSVFSPSVFSPSVFSETEIEQAFSSAQTRSLIGVSATPGTGNESVVVNSWNNTGSFYVRVSGRSGAFDPDDLFTVTVQKSTSTCGALTTTELAPRPANADAGQYRTVILTDSSRLALGSASDPGSLRSKLAAFAARAEVDGVLVDVAGDTTVAALRAQVQANIGCPFAVNLLAEEIKGIVDSYRSPSSSSEALRYVTIVGGDTVIPFFRYPDQSLLGQESGYYPPVRSDTISEASLRRDFVLSQDAYGSGVSVDIRTNTFPVPGLAVGRLVETPAEIAGMLDAYATANGTVSPSSSLVTGYDFLADAAGAVGAELAQGTGGAVDSLVTPSGVSPQDPASWTADQLRTKLLGSRHDISFLAGHFSANSALAADFATSLLTTELAASSVDLVNALVFSAGCHSGYNLLDGEALAGVALPLDWAQAFAQKRAVLIAGTGYQYGDTDFLEYSERLYRDFARELRAGVAGTSVAVGDALANAKRAYLATTPDIRGIHEKAILEATLFGLPMFGVNMPAGRGATPGGAGTIDPDDVTAGPAATLGLSTHDLSVSTPTSSHSRTLDVIESTGVTGTVDAGWLEGPDGVVTNPAEPAIPKHVVNVTSVNAGQVLRGVGFRGGTYADTGNILPLTGAPTTELRGVHAPFVSPVFYPMRLATPNYFGVLGGSGGTNLIVTPVQHRSDDTHAGRSIRRVFSQVDLRLFYSSNLTPAALSDAPTIVNVEAQPNGADLVFRAQVVGDPKAAIQQVWVTWTAGLGTWSPLDLAQCVAPLPADCGGTEDSRTWVGRLTAAPADVRYVAQAANGVGLVSFDDNRGQYYRAAGITAAETTLSLVAPSSSGQFGQTASITAELKAGTAPVAGRTVTIAVGGTATVGITGADGRLTLGIPLNTQPATTEVKASFGGDGTFGPSSAASPFTISKAVTQLVLSGPAGTVLGGSSALVATLTSGGGPLMQRTVAFTVTAPNGTVTLSTAITDFLGRAILVLPTATVGQYGIVAAFGSVVAVPGGGSQDLTDRAYGPSSATAQHLVLWPFAGFYAPVDNLPTLNQAKAGQAIPVKFSLGGNRGLSIFRSGYPKATTITCASGAPTDTVEETVTASTAGLTYDATTNRYQYTWKSAKSMGGKCWQLQLGLIDGSSITANFKLK